MASRFIFDSPAISNNQEDMSKHLIYLKYILLKKKEKKKSLEVFVSTKSSFSFAR